VDLGSHVVCPLNTGGKPWIAGGNPLSKAGKILLMHCVLRYIQDLSRHEENSLYSMSSQRSKVKIATMTLRVDPKVKAVADAVANREHRSVTNLIEMLILNHCHSLGLTTGQSGKDLHQ